MFHQEVYHNGRGRGRSRSYNNRVYKNFDGMPHAFDDLGKHVEDMNGTSDFNKMDKFNQALRDAGGLYPKSPNVNKGKGDYENFTNNFSNNSGHFPNKSSNFNTNRGRGRGQRNQSNRKPDALFQVNSSSDTFANNTNTFSIGRGHGNFAQPAVERVNPFQKKENRPRNESANKLENALMGEISGNSLSNRDRGKSRGRGQRNQVYKNNVQSITPADRAARFGSSSKSEIYAQMKKDRVIEREQAIKNGLIPDPNAPRRLEDAIDFRGVCRLKCPEFEMVERDIQNNVDRLEMDEEGNLDKNKAVKAYRRSAAGNDQPLPADVRSPEALITTLDYLVDKVLSEYSLEKCHAFIRDRTRSIRQDFTLQNIRDITAVQVHERIARFHILCLHEMCGMDESKFSEQQETEQLRKVLLSLMEFYEDLREEGIETPNEAEFRAYYILTHIRDKDVVKQITSQPVHIFKHPHIQTALRFHAMAQRNNEIEETSSRRNKAENALASKNSYASFFKWIASPKTPFLMACLLETHFPEVRKGALKAMNVGYMMRAAGVEASYIQSVLCYDSLSQCLQEAKHYGIGMDMSLEEPTLLFGQKHYETRVHIFLEPLSYLPQKKSAMVEIKKAEQSFRDIVNGANTPISAPVYTPKAPTNVPARIINSPFAEQHLNSSKDAVSRAKTALEAAEHQKRMELLSETKRQAEQAEAIASEERKKLELFIKQKKQEQLKQEQARLAQKEVERQRQAQLRLQEEELKERARRVQEEAARRRLVEEQQRREAEERRRKEEEKARRRKLREKEAQKLLDEIMEQIIREKAQELVYKNLKLRKILKKKATGWTTKARERILKRNAEIALLKSRHDFSWAVVRHHPFCKFSCFTNNTPKFSEEEIKKRVRQSMIAEQLVIEKNMSVDNHQDLIWQTEDFSPKIYAQIWNQVDEFKRKHSILPKKLNWQLLIDVENTQSQSSTWFKSKFGLDDEFLRKTDYYTTNDITCRMISPETNPITKPIAEEIGGIVFALPESNINDQIEQETQDYWDRCSARLSDLIKEIGKHNPTATFPLLITYFPYGVDTAETLKKIPSLLDLSGHESIKDFRLLVMNPETIPTRIVDEVNWLASQSSITFPV